MTRNVTVRKVKPTRSGRNINIYIKKNGHVPDASSSSSWRPNPRAFYFLLRDPAQVEKTIRIMIIVIKNGDFF